MDGKGTHIVGFMIGMALCGLVFIMVGSDAKVAWVVTLGVFLLTLGVLTIAWDIINLCRQIRKEKRGIK